MKSSVVRFQLATICFLSLLFQDAVGVALECKESETGGDSVVDCELVLGYDALSRAFNMECTPSKDGVKCSFQVDRKVGEFVNRPAMQRDTKPVACSPTGVCVTSHIHSQIEINTSERLAGDTDNNDSQNNQYQPENQQQTEMLEIHIGRHTYKKPFEQYAAPVARVLKEKGHLWAQSPRHATMKYSLANGYLDLGIAHLSALLDEDQNPGIYSINSNLNEDSFNLEFSLDAFQQAESLFKQVLEEHYDTHVVHSSLGSLYLQWGEVYNSPHYFSGDEEGDMLKNNELSLQYYRKSEEQYRLSIETGRDVADDMTILDAKINLAHVTHRVGRCLVNSVHDISGGEATLDLESLGDMTEEATENFIPQMGKLMTIIPQAESKFEEAAQIYRQAIEEETRFDEKVRLKNCLATTLQDHGSACTYVSNLPKAIELQEASISICEEILPHLSTTEADFMKQYIGDSLYNIANNYMQQGKYDETKETYQKAMDWYEKYELEAAVADIAGGGLLVGDETLEAYEKQLADYRELLLEISIPDGYADDEQMMYGPNDAYEGDLHAALGSVHLSRNEVVMAIDHFNQAIRLYENDQSGENLDRSIADVKVSLKSAFTEHVSRITVVVHGPSDIVVFNVFRRVWQQLFSRIVNSARVQKYITRRWISIVKLLAKAKTRF
jgi:tetratricopeptide (TPR) repeat protein